MRQGMIHIYCGDGKGKTTAATGLAVRAAGSGMKVLFARFLKNENSAELCVLDQIPGIEVIHLPKSSVSKRWTRKSQPSDPSAGRGWKTGGPGSSL